MFPSMGWGWWTILNPSWWTKISSQKNATKFNELTSYTSVICSKFRIFDNFYWASLKNAS